jgi:hypothetical protein
VRHPSETVPPPLEELQQEYAERQANGMAEAHEHRRRSLRNVTLAGAAAGLAAVVITAGATRRGIFWHSFLLETVLCAIAGHVLVRLDGGLLKGVLLFAGAYFAAFLLRALGLDPSVLFAAGDLRAGAAVQGHFATLCFLVTTGGVLGHIVADR